VQESVYVSLWQCVCVCVSMSVSPLAAELDADEDSSGLDLLIRTPCSKTHTHIRPPQFLLALSFSSLFPCSFLNPFLHLTPTRSAADRPTTSHNEVALHHHKHCCVSKWAGEEAGRFSALFPNYLLLAEHRWRWEEEGKGRQRWKYMWLGEMRAINERGRELKFIIFM